MWISRPPGRKAGDKWGCAGSRADRMLHRSRRGGQTAPEIASTVRRRFLRDVLVPGLFPARKVALQPPNHLGGFAGLVPRLRGWSCEGAELAVAGIAEPRDDVAAFVERPIDSRDVDVDIRVRSGEGGHALGCRNQ